MPRDKELQEAVVTLPAAHDTARSAAARFGKAFRVYRLHGWPPAVYGATSIDLPSEAYIVQTYPQPSTISLTPSSQARVDPQGSLF